MRLRGSALAACAVLIACGNDDADAPAINTPLILNIFEGNAQTAPVGEFTAKAPAVKVTSGDNFAVPHVTVLFEVLGTRGQVVGGGSQITGDDGVARIAGWRLGNSPGPNTVTATVQHATPYAVTFTAIGVAPAAIRRKR